MGFAHGHSQRNLTCVGHSSEQKPTLPPILLAHIPAEGDQVCVNLFPLPQTSSSPPLPPGWRRPCTTSQTSCCSRSASTWARWTSPAAPGSATPRASLPVVPPSSDPLPSYRCNEFLSCLVPWHANHQKSGSKWVKVGRTRPAQAFVQSHALAAPSAARRPPTRCGSCTAAMRSSGRGPPRRAMHRCAAATPALIYGGLGICPFGQ